MPQTSGESLRERLQLFHFPICLLSHPLYSNTSPLVGFVLIYITVLRLSGVSLYLVSQQLAVFHMSTLTPREHICTVTKPLRPLTWHSPGCWLFDRSRGILVPTSLSVPLLSCLSGPFRYNIWPILTAWIIQRVWTIRELQRFNKRKLCFSP